MLQYIPFNIWTSTAANLQVNLLDWSDNFYYTKQAQDKTMAQAKLFFFG